MSTMTGARAQQTVDDLERQAVFDQEPEKFTSVAKAPLPWSYKEIKNLLWIKGSESDPVYKEALEEWERKTKLFASRVERKSNQSGAAKNEIYNLIGFYSVFQGVVLTAVSQSQPTVLQCRKFWIPVVLSVLASAVTFVGILQKLKEIEELENTIQGDIGHLKEIDKRDWALRHYGQEFRFANFRENKKIEETEKARSWSIVFVKVTLALFAVAFPVFQWVLLCM